MRPVLGILGGMGPAATVLFLERLVEYTIATSDQDHIQSVTLMQCDVPDRSTAISRGDDAPAIAMRRGMVRLEQAGVNFIAIPCNTAMYWYADLAETSSVPVLNIISETCRVLCRADIEAVHVWGTFGTRQCGIYESYLEAHGINVMPHSTRIQAQLDQLISAVKEGRYTDFEPLLVEPMSHVLNFDSQIPVVLACTELSLVFQDVNMAVRYVDSLDCLALRCFDLAGVTNQSPRWLSAL